MNIPLKRSIVLACALCAVAACTRGASTSPGGGANAPTGDTGTSVPTASKAAPANAGNACDRKLLTSSDMAGILNEPITGTEPLKGDAQTCYFVTATTDSQGGPEIMISLRPGLGEATLGTFTSGKMDAYAKSTPLPGVGDGAVWLPGTYEVDAQKNNVLCVAGLGGSAVIEHKPDDLKKKLGDLCNKIFAAY